LVTAIEFSNFSGGEGLVLKIDIVSGKSIQDYSAIPVENEILLSPNMSFIVSKGLHRTKDGLLSIQLVQVSLESTFVF